MLSVTPSHCCPQLQQCPFQFLCHLSLLLPLPFLCGFTCLPFIPTALSAVAILNPYILNIQFIFIPVNSLGKFFFLFFNFFLWAVFFSPSTILSYSVLLCIHPVCLLYTYVDAIRIYSPLGVQMYGHKPHLPPFRMRDFFKRVDR